MNSIVEQQNYIAALKFDRLTGFYDPLIRWMLREQKFKNELIRQANIAPGHRVLDVGCGTATLTLLIKQQHPQAKVVGLDGDDKVFAMHATRSPGPDSILI